MRSTLPCSGLTLIPPKPLFPLSKSQPCLASLGGNSPHHPCARYAIIERIKFEPSTGMTLNQPVTLIVTLGGQPQVITFALDALLAQGEAISDVYVLHLSFANPRTRQAWQRL